MVDLKSTSGATASMFHRKATDKTFYNAYVGTTGIVSDRFKTSPETIAALEFFIGGRVGINKDTEVEVTSERSVADRGTSPQRIILHAGTIWMKSQRLRRPLEIQTNGGTMGIRGTEFVVDAGPDNTQLSVLEGSVEVKDAQRNFIGLAEPGDVYQLSLSGPAKKDHVDPQELRKSLVSSPFGAELEAIEVWSLQMGVQSLKSDLTNFSDKLDSLLRATEQPKIQLGKPYQDAILKTPELGGVSNPQASLSPQSQPVFRWNPFPQADGYVVFLSDDADFSDILFSARTRDSVVVYPDTSRPLTPGSYHWRIVPVDSEDRPMHGATQATFRVPTPG